MSNYNKAHFKELMKQKILLKETHCTDINEPIECWEFQKNMWNYHPVKVKVQKYPGK